jgi:hypothetical protein
VYAWHVVLKMGITLPNNKPSENPITENVYDGLKNKLNPNWLFLGDYPNGITSAISNANAGRPTIAISKIPNHMAMVRPQPTDIAVPRFLIISQAGKICKYETQLNLAWSADDLPAVSFWTYIGQIIVPQPGGI